MLHQIVSWAISSSTHIFHCSLCSPLPSPFTLSLIAGSAIFIVCTSSVALMSFLMALTVIKLSLNLNNPLIRSAGGITLVVYIGFLFFKMVMTVLLMYDAEQLEGVCLVRPITFLIGVTGSSAVLFFRMLRWETST